MNELDLIKASVRDPASVADFSQLTFVDDKLAGNGQIRIEEQVMNDNRKLIRFFYKVWSGFTKFIRGQLRQGKAVYSPLFGCFIPMDLLDGHRGTNTIAYLPASDFIKHGKFIYTED
jgi:hypothetical protein